MSVKGCSWLQSDSERCASSFPGVLSPLRSHLRLSSLGGAAAVQQFCEKQHDLYRRTNNIHMHSTDRNHRLLLVFLLHC